MATKNIDIVINAKDNASKAFDTLGDKIKKNLNTIKVASGAVSAGLVALGKKFLDASIENEPLQKSFERLSESAGIASDEMLNAMRKASQGTVADTNLMAQANKAYALGIVKSADDMATMIEIARLKGQAMGRTMEEALGDITTGLGRGSAQILDNLGIVINAEEVNEKYAESIGKTVKELTEEEKKQALVNAVIEQGRKELEQAGDVQLTMQEKISKLNATRENTKNVIGDALVPVLDRLLTSITPIIEKVATWIEENPELTANILLATTAIAGLTFACTTIIPALTTIVGLLSGPAGRIVAIAGVVAGLYALDEKLMSTDEQVLFYQQELANLHLEYENGSITLEEYTAKTEEINAKIAEAEAKHRTLGGYLKDNFINTLHGILHPLDENNGGLRAWIDLLKMLKDWLVDVSNTIKNSFIKVVDEAISALRRLWDMMQQVGVDVSNSISSAWKSTTSRVSSKISGFANGGNVAGNVPILVGEKGPEIFVPNTAGSIIPNNELGGSVNVNINFGGVAVNNGTDEIQFAEMISNTITRELELYQKGIY